MPFTSYQASRVLRWQKHRLSEWAQYFPQQSYVNDVDCTSLHRSVFESCRAPCSEPSAQLCLSASCCGILFIDKKVTCFTDSVCRLGGSSVTSPKFWGGANTWTLSEQQYFVWDTACLSKHKMTRYARNFWDMIPLASLATPMLGGTEFAHGFLHKLFRCKYLSCEIIRTKLTLSNWHYSFLL